MSRSMTEERQARLRTNAATRHLRVGAHVESHYRARWSGIVVAHVECRPGRYLPLVLVTHDRHGKWVNKQFKPFPGGLDPHYLAVRPVNMAARYLVCVAQGYGCGGEFVFGSDDLGEARAYADAHNRHADRRAHGAWIHEQKF